MHEPHFPYKRAEPQRCGLLLIEKHRLSRHALREAFRAQGFIVWAAKDGGIAFDLLPQVAPALLVVLADLAAPRMDRQSLYRTLAELCPFAKICFMANGDRGGDPQQLLLEGAAAVFQKPIRLSKIAKAVTALSGMEKPRCWKPAITGKGQSLWSRVREALGYQSPKQ